MTYFTIPVQEDNEYGVTGFLRRNGLSSHLNLQGIWAHMLHLWNDCNGRLIDKLPVPVLALMPRWLFSLVNAGVYVLFTQAHARLSHSLLVANGVERP